MTWRERLFDADRRESGRPRRRWGFTPKPSPPPRGLGRATRIRGQESSDAVEEEFSRARSRRRRG